VHRTITFKTPLRKFMKTEDFSFLEHVVLKLALQAMAGILSNFFDVSFYSQLQSFYFVVEAFVVF
jgi:hypothetical protein